MWLWLIFAFDWHRQHRLGGRPPKDVGSGAARTIQPVERRSVEADGSSSTTEYEQVWRVQTEEGKINGSVKEIEYNAFTDKVEVLRGQNGQRQTESKFRCRRRRSKIATRVNRSRDYDPVKVKSLVYPQVHEVGSVLVLKYKVRSSTPPLGSEPMEYAFYFPDRTFWSNR